MLSDKIKVTNTLCDIIRSKRLEKKMSGAELSKKINQTSSYISALENNRIKHITLSTLTSIIKIIFNIDNDAEAELKIKELTSGTVIDVVTNNAEEENGVSIDLSESSNIHEYTTPEHNSNKAKISDFIELWDNILNLLQKKDANTVDRIINCHFRNAKFDLGFMLAIWKTPFFVLENLTHEERQEFLNNFFELFNKFALIAKNKEPSKSSDNIGGTHELDKGNPSEADNKKENNNQVNKKNASDKKENNL